MKLDTLYEVGDNVAQLGSPVVMTVTSIEPLYSCLLPGQLQVYKIAESRLVSVPKECPHEFENGVSWRIPLGVSHRRLLYCPDCGEQL